MKGWLGIAVFVAIYDAWAGTTGRPTLSREFRDHSRSHPLPIGISTAFLIAHLYGTVPRKVDPLCMYIDMFGRLAPAVALWRLGAPELGQPASVPGGRLLGVSRRSRWQRGIRWRVRWKRQNLADQQTT